MGKITHKSDMSRLADGISWVYLFILGTLPFHAFLTTWAGSNFGHLDLWRIWKEIIVTITVPFVLYILAKEPKLINWAKKSWLARLVLMYMCLYILSGILALLQGNVNSDALVYALFANLRYLGFMMLVIAVASVSGVIRKHILKVVMISASVVVLFGLLQLFLPYDFLKHFGYGPNTIPAFQTVDNKLDYQRIQSTLRGANPLGAYLVVVISVLGAAWLKFAKYRIHLTFFGVLSSVVLLFSFSRSAYLGVLIVVMVGVAMTINKQWRRRAAGLLAILLVVVSLGFLSLRDQSVVQNTLFHSDDSSKSAQSSNAGRAAALETGLHDVTTEPLGRGPGTAGPESTRNKYPARISENYFLQIGQEVGWLGLALFVMINIMIGAELWYQRRDALGLATLSSLAGLTFVNLISHAWADDTLGLLWWGLAGVVVGSVIMKSNLKDKQHAAAPTEKTTKRS